MRQTILALLSLSSLVSCKTTASQSAVKDTAGASASSGPLNEIDLYATAHYGLFFYDANSIPVAALPGQTNPNFDPSKPTIIFIQGWSPGELTKKVPRTFNYSQRYAHGPDVNLLQLWLNAGWNFGFFDWTQFADTQFETNTIGALPGAKVYDDAERRIWARDDQNQLIYHLSNGTPVNVPDASVTAMMAKSYADFMSTQNYTGGEVRLYGHSLGTQLAISISYTLYQQTPALSPAILPQRVSLTDLTSSNCAHPWLPATQPHQRLPTPVCPNPTVPGDWVGERLAEYVQSMKAVTPTPVNIDAYRCWLVSSSGVGADREEAVNAQIAFTQMKPNVGITNFDEKHAFCNWTYLYSKGFPPPPVINAGTTPIISSQAATISCDNALPGAPSASSTSEFIAMAMNSNVQFVQTVESSGSSPGNYQFTCSPR